MPQCSAALVAVVAASCACEFSLCQRGLYFYLGLVSHTHPCNRESSTRNPLCHFFLFSKCAVLGNRVCALLLLLTLCVSGGD
jgi:hypothetical protein